MIRLIWVFIVSSGCCFFGGGGGGCLLVFSGPGSFLNIYDFNDQLKIHVLGNKALFVSFFLSRSLSLSLSLSFVFFLFLRVTRYLMHHMVIRRHMKSTDGLVPVRVWVSYESMARGKSVWNHPNASVTRSNVLVRIWVSYKSIARGKSVRNHPNASVTWSSPAVHGPHRGKILENLWVIPRYAVRARKIFRRF